MIQSSFYNIPIEKQEYFWDHAIKFFARTGYHAGSMSLLAKELGMAKGLPYLYFINKEDLYIHVCLESLRRIRAVLFQNNLEKENIFVLVEQMLIRGKYICKNSPEIFLFYFNPASTVDSERFKDLQKEVEKESVRVLKQKLLDAQENQAIPKSLDIKMTAYMIHSIFLNYCSSLIIYKQKMRLAQYLETDQIDDPAFAHEYLVSTLKIIWRILAVPDHPIDIKEIV